MLGFSAAAGPVGAVGLAVVAWLDLLTFRGSTVVAVLFGAAFAKFVVSVSIAQIPPLPANEGELLATGVIPQERTTFVIAAVTGSAMSVAMLGVGVAMTEILKSTDRATDAAATTPALFSLAAVIGFLLFALCSLGRVVSLQKQSGLRLLTPDGLLRPMPRWWGPDPEQRLEAPVDGSGT